MPNIKKIIKKILNKDYEFSKGKTNPNNYPKSVCDLIKAKPELGDNQIALNKRPDKEEYSKDIQRIIEGWDLLNIELKKYGNPKVPDIFEYDGLHSGTPIKYKRFKGCINRIKRVNFDKTLYWYPGTVGSIVARQDFINYLHREGLPKKASEGYDGINLNNVVFTCSTTHAFTLILKTIARPHDVIIMPAPNYGLFAIAPERVNANVELINLKEEDNFFINPISLGEKIDKINEELKEKYKGKLDYTPKVVAYLNLNPHNPIGNVMTKDNLELLTNLGETCLQRGVFIIDDLIYRDLCFDQKKKAYPISFITKYFNNTISLYGISKSYGLAGFRSGVIVCPEPVFWGIATEIFESMDSIPVLQVKAMQGAFNGTNKRYRDVNKYFKSLLDKYQYYLKFTEALIYGINKVEPQYQSKIIKDILKLEPNKKWQEKLLTPIPHLKIRANTYPQSGFFIILDFTDAKGLYYKGEQIKTEFDLLKAFYNRGKVKYLMGLNIGWPYKDEFVARANFALEKPALIKNFKIIREVLEDLSDKEN